MLGVYLFITEVTLNPLRLFVPVTTAVTALRVYKRVETRLLSNNVPDVSSFRVVGHKYLQKQHYYNKIGENTNI